MRQFYILIKSQAVPDQLIKGLTWSHIQVLLCLKNNSEINYYANICLNQRIGYRQLHKKIKDKEYQRLSSKTKYKLINNKELDIYDNIKNPIYINMYDNNVDKENVEEKALKLFILRDMDNFLEQLGDGFFYRKK